MILRNHVLWVVAPCDLVISYRRLEETYRLYLQEYESVHGPITQKMKAARSFETSERKYLSTRRNNAEDQLSHYENRFVINKVIQRRVISSV